MLHANDEYRVAGTITGAAGGTSWDPTCDVGLLRPTIRPNVHSVRFANLPAGDYEYKISVNGSWSTSYGFDARCDPGCPNIKLSLSAPSDVVVFFDAVTHFVDTDILDLSKGERSRNSSRRNSPRAQEEHDRVRQQLFKHVLDADGGQRSPRRGDEARTRVLKQAAAAGADRLARISLEEVVAREQVDQLWQQSRLFAIATCVRMAEEDAQYAHSTGASTTGDEATTAAPALPVGQPSVTIFDQQPVSTSAPVPAVITPFTHTSTKIEPEVLVVPRDTEAGLCSQFIEVIKLVFRPVCGASTAATTHTLTA